TELARLWMSKLHGACPDNWKKQLPALDFEIPDRMLAANSLPVLSFLPRMLELASEENLALVNQLSCCYQNLHFNQTYSADDFGSAFLLQYGWIKFLGPDAYWHSDELSSGLILLGSNITYPQHWHVAEELYFPVSGTADWYHETAGWRTISPGKVIHHASNIKHSMRTTGEPLLALYLWRGGDLEQKSNI
ncbi:MAG: dimethylsulfonioproprionate lyase family protein, partial [Pseudomonadota bacterium]